MKHIDEYQLKVEAALTPCCDHEPYDWVYDPAPALRRGWVFLGGRFVCIECRATTSPPDAPASESGEK